MTKFDRIEEFCRKLIQESKKCDSEHITPTFEALSLSLLFLNDPLYGDIL